jgi:hypothetical protein
MATKTSTAKATATTATDYATATGAITNAT